MDDGVFPLDNALGGPSQSPMDLDFMNELLLEGCWLEMSDGSSFLHQTPSSYGTFYDSSYPWPLLEICNSSKTNPNPNPNLNPSQKNTQEQTIQSSDLLVNSPIFNPLVANLASSGSLAQPNDVFRDGSELNRVFWIGPRANPTASSVMERLIKALSYIKDSTLNTNMLVQIWLPVNRGETRVLTTSQQPFEISSRSSQLESYRGISVNYQFAAEEDSKVSVGLPGRVFLGKVPEWTPDVRFFRAEEYPRVGHAQQCDVRGTLALPVFEQESRNCLGVIEVVMTTQKVNYRTELESVCRALEAVHLRSSEFLRSQNIKEYNSSYKAALPEILQVLKAACETHSLPLAQTWVPCIQQGKQGCRHSDTNLVNCVSTIDFACFVADPSIQGFHEACSEHHLLKPKGVVGKAFTTNQPCFCADVTAYSKTEYPLSHYAMMFNLCAVVAIRLRCIYTCNSDFVLEFFLPKDCRAPEEQKKMLTSLSVIIQRVCRSLRVVTDKEVEEEAAISINNLTVPKLENTGSVSSPQDEPSSSKRGPILGQDKPIVGESEFSSMGKQGEKKRSKAEKSITLDVLRQHFAGSLKDAAKSIGVCPTTLKRICRQHGIKRWPSRKIKKVGHSLQKLQVVIDSVQGASGAFQIGSFYSNFPDITSPNLSERSPFSTAKPCQCSEPSNQDPEGGSGAFSPQTAASKSPSSSCSQTSSSSQCCSSGTQQQTWNSPVADHSLTGENSNTDVLKRAKSEAELHKGLNQESTQLIIRSQSQKTLFDHQNTDVLPPFPKFGGADFLQEGDALRVKVTYGEEKIRFRMLKSWRFKELVHEVVRRFNIGDICGFHLKYLDDDSEWVLLTCDADLEECIDIYRSSNRQTIKLSLQVSHNHSRSSVGSNGHL